MRVSVPKAVLAGLAVLGGGGLACWSPPASAALTGHRFSFSFGSFSKPNNIAVDQATGNVFVVDSGANLVKVFGAEGGSPMAGAPTELTGAQAPQGSFNFNGEPAGVAVDNSASSSAGDIYVSDVVNQVVDKFDAAGVYLCQFRSESQACLPESEEAPTLGETTGVTVDNLGNVYVSDYTHSLVAEYNAAGEPIGPISGGGMIHPAGVAVDSHGVLYVQEYHGGLFKFTSGQGELLDGGESFAVAADRSSDEAYVDHGEALEVYSSSGEALQHFGEGQLVASEGVAIREATGMVYVANGGSGEVDAFSQYLVPGPQLAVGAASGVTHSTAILSAGISSAGLATRYYVAYGTTAGYGSTTPLANVLGNGEVVTLRLGGLLPGTTYHYAVVAEDAAGVTRGPDQSFTTLPPTPPTALAGPVSDITQTSATFAAVVNPGGLETHYELQIGTDSSYGTNLYGDAGFTDLAVPVQVGLVGLVAGTTYHYRLLASNSDGSATTADGTFTSAAAPDLALALALAPQAVLTPSIASLEGQSAKPNPKPRPKPKPKHRHKSKKKHKQALKLKQQQKKRK